jgi:hypothetical protein
MILDNNICIHSECHHHDDPFHGNCDLVTPVNCELKKYMDNMTKELNDADKDIRFLNALRAAGVDNWQGYDIAIDMLDED